MFVSQGIDEDCEFGLRYRTGLYLDRLVQGIFGLGGDHFLGAGNSGDFFPGMIDARGFELIANRVCQPIGQKSQMQVGLG